MKIPCIMLALVVASAAARAEEPAKPAAKMTREEALGSLGWTDVQDHLFAIVKSRSDGFSAFKGAQLAKDEHGLTFAATNDEISASWQLVVTSLDGKTSLFSAFFLGKFSTSIQLAIMRMDSNLGGKKFEGYRLVRDTNAAGGVTMSIEYDKRPVLFFKSAKKDGDAFMVVGELALEAVSALAPTKEAVLASVALVDAKYAKPKVIYTNLNAALLENDTDALAEMIAKGADVNGHYDCRGKSLTPLLCICGPMKNVKEDDTFKWLVEQKGVDLNAVDDEGFTALMRSIDCYAEKRIEQLLAHDVNTKIKAKHGQTALSLAKEQAKSDAERLKPLIARLKR